LTEQENTHRRSNRFFLKIAGRQLRAYQLERPEIIPRSQALAAYPRLWRWTLRRQQIDEFVWAHGELLRTAEGDAVDPLRRGR